MNRIGLIHQSSFYFRMEEVAGPRKISVCPRQYANNEEKVMLSPSFSTDEPQAVS
jgi:hypothetical protein